VPEGNQRWSVPSHRFGASVIIGVIGVFVVCGSAGMGNATVAAIGVALIAGAVGLYVISAVNGRTFAYVLGSGHVVSASEPPSSSSRGRCNMHLLVTARNMNGIAVKIRDAQVPVAKWPDAGSDLPILVAVGDPRRVKVLWDEVQAHGQVTRLVRAGAANRGAIGIETVELDPDIAFDLDDSDVVEVLDDSDVAEDPDEADLDVADDGLGEVEDEDEPDADASPDSPAYADSTAYAESADFSSSTAYADSADDRPRPSPRARPRPAPRVEEPSLDFAAVMAQDFAGTDSTPVDTDALDDEGDAYLDVTEADGRRTIELDVLDPSILRWSPATVEDDPDAPSADLVDDTRTASRDAAYDVGAAVAGAAAEGSTTSVPDATTPGSGATGGADGAATAAVTADGEGSGIRRDSATEAMPPVDTSAVTDAVTAADASRAANTSAAADAAAAYASRAANAPTPADTGAAANAPRAANSPTAADPLSAANTSRAANAATSADVFAGDAEAAADTANAANAPLAANAPTPADTGAAANAPRAADTATAADTSRVTDAVTPAGVFAGDAEAAADTSLAGGAGNSAETSLAGDTQSATDSLTDADALTGADGSTTAPASDDADTSADSAASIADSTGAASVPLPRRTPSPRPRMAMDPTIPTTEPVAIPVTTPAAAAAAGEQEIPDVIGVSFGAATATAAPTIAPSEAAPIQFHEAHVVTPAVRADTDAGADDLAGTAAPIADAYLAATPPPGLGVNPSRVRSVAVTLFVQDLSQSIIFYRDLLGFSESDAGRGSAVLVSGDARIVLRRVAMAPVDRRLVQLLLEVPDVDAAYTDLRGRGVTFLHRPRPVGQYEQMTLWAAAFRDPDGHGIAVTQWRSA
jgi:catechol 2,3-dioxygenase-like lactoylglutathione lyase family enzyme